MTDPVDRPQRARRSFAPVVLLGLAAAGLAATAGTKPWVTGRSGSVDTSAGSAMTAALSLDVVGESPLAGALALAVLACWGVVLVTRGRVRRAVALLGLVGAVGLLVVTIAELWTLPDKLSAALTEVSGTATVRTSFTPWYAAALVGAVLSVLTTVAAVRLVRHWPEMGTKYDAPTGTRTDEAPAQPTENIDIWKALDEGRDPTA
jgi:uncharacterized membrane protein (TIGR02234 family)